MLKVAASAWQEWDDSKRRTARAVWVAKKVNKVFGKSRFIAPKWVNQDRKMIEAVRDKTVA